MPSVVEPKLDVAGGRPLPPRQQHKIHKFPRGNSCSLRTLPSSRGFASRVSHIGGLVCSGWLVVCPGALAVARRSWIRRKIRIFCEGALKLLNGRARGSLEAAGLVGDSFQELALY
uniref:Uncharacterized protein n=1 Tax=Leersia perrieri TaxID=77586 RepID=A0A0D9V701_9ORYZ